MFELTNEQRKCFGLLPVDSNWTRIEPKPSPYDQHTTISYLDGTVIRKVILTGYNLYNEYEISEQLSDDLQYLLPKTEKGKPVLLSASTLTKRTPLGMGLSYGRSSSGYSYIDICSHTSQNAIIPTLTRQFVPTERMIFNNGWRTGALKPPEMIYLISPILPLSSGNL